MVSGFILTLLVEVDQLKVEGKRRMDEDILDKIRGEIERRRIILISMANDTEIPMDQTDRRHIKLYLENQQLPQKPESVPEFLKHYASSCLSYSIVRKQLGGLIGEIPTANTIPNCLEALFDEQGFLVDVNWTLANFCSLVDNLRYQEGFSDADLNSKELKPRVLAVLLDGSKVFGTELESVLDAFYIKVQAMVDNGAESAWRFAEGFSKRIRQVGPVLICDFLKNIGFPEFVKVDHHFKKEFPGLFGHEHKMRLSDKKRFILSLKLCSKLKITPFLFDHIMYQWGRYNPERRPIDSEFQSSPKQPVMRKGKRKSGEDRFDQLSKIKKWKDECTKLTVHRQDQLLKILNQYDGRKIPFSHFTVEICNNTSLRNSQAYPAVCAYHCGILKKEEDKLIMPEGLQMGGRELSICETFWTKIR